MIYVIKQKIKALFWWLAWKIFGVKCGVPLKPYTYPAGSPCKLRRYHKGVHENDIRWWTFQATGLLVNRKSKA